MPASVVKSKRDERIWEMAKQRAESEYGKKPKDGAKFYRLAMGIFQKAKGK